jgi:hypothetical protein
MGVRSTRRPRVTTAYSAPAARTGAGAPSRGVASTAAMRNTGAACQKLKGNQPGAGKASGSAAEATSTKAPAPTASRWAGSERPQATSAIARNDPATGVVSPASAPKASPAEAKATRRPPVEAQPRDRARTQPRASAPPAMVGSWPMATGTSVRRAKYHEAAGRQAGPSTKRSKQYAEPAADRAATGQRPR